MSAGSQALERSALEAKDRESLQQIALAMGGKPASRAKKADIVDLILELAGVTTKEATPAPAAGPAKRPARGRASAGGDESAGADANTTSNEPPAATSPTNGSGKTGSGSERGGRNGQSQVRTAEPGDDTGASDDASPAPVLAGDAASGSSAAAAGAAGGQAARDEGDVGNRRRRRRGRDRDRPREGQPAPGDRPEQRPAGAAAVADDQFLGEPVEVTGLLDLRDEGYGFLRLKGYLPSKDDVYVSVKQVRQFGLRKGDHLKGAARPASRNEKNPALLRIDEVNEADPEANGNRARFDELTPVFPDQQLVLETPDDPSNLTGRIIDLVAPIGRGQRGLIVAPPRSDKTAIIKRVARAIETNAPDVHLMVVLVDERPEEVTDMRRSLQAEVIASTFDRPADEHTMVAELAIERAKRLVEDGRDVVMIVDGITRLARAYNLSAPASSRVTASGLDPTALYAPKRFFGAARKVEEGGSLTILATVMVDTGSRIDDVIAEEFATTANMQLRLDAHLADRRIDPAIDLAASCTRNDQLLVPADRVPQIAALGRLLAGGTGDATEGESGTEMLIRRLAGSVTNDSFLAEIG